MRSLMLLILGLGLVFPCFARAQETPAAETQAAEPAPAVEELPFEEVIIPTAEEADAEIQVIDGSEEIGIRPKEAFALPQCDNEPMIAKIIAKVNAYNKEHPVASIMEKRNQALMLKNLRHFTEADPANFTAEQNFNVANKILMTKINYGLDDSDLRLCKNAGRGKAADIYLLIYPMWGNVYVSIINFVPQTSEKDDFFIIYNEDK